MIIDSFKDGLSANLARSWAKPLFQKHPARSAFYILCCIMWSKLWVLACAGSCVFAEEPLQQGLLQADDECTDGSEACSLNALQLRGGSVDDNDTQMTWVTTILNDTTNETVPLPGLKSGWGWGGDKVWGNGRGIETASAGSLNGGFSAARRGCGGSGCAQIINPPGHRSINRIHIHSVHYGGYGHSLKSRLEHMTCHGGGWHSGGLPCHGKARFYPGSPGVGSAAMSSGNIQHATVVSWPGACGGRGTIVQVGYGCSIEHQIRGDYNPRLR
jgi:hypothetical protein